MCGRYRLSRRKQIIEEQFDCDPWEGDWEPRYNIAPTQPVPVIRQHPKGPVRQIATMRWGLIPNWAKDPSVATGTINAKSETAATKPAFRDPLKLRRCLIPADGFYEWKKTGSAKQPFCFEVGEGELFVFAGLWDGWKNADGQWIKTCSILTTTPNAVTSTVHNRMPVILDSDSYDLWLDPGMQNVAAISELLKPYDASLMRSYPVSTRLNHVANDDEALREAAFGNAADAKRAAAEGLKLSGSQGVKGVEVALAFAMAGDTARADSLAKDLNQRFPLDTQMQSLWLPAIRAQLALNRKNPADALNALQTASPPIEFGEIAFVANISCLYPTYIRGEAYVAAVQGKEAAAEFQKILDHSGIVWNCWTGALARLGVARANALQARTSQGADADAARVRALAAYKDFLTLWKDADPDIPIYKQAKAEYAKLQ